MAIVSNIVTVSYHRQACVELVSSARITVNQVVGEVRRLI